MVAVFIKKTVDIELKRFIYLPSLGNIPSIRGHEHLLDKQTQKANIRLKPDVSLQISTQLIMERVQDLFSTFLVLLLPSIY